MEQDYFMSLVEGAIKDLKKKGLSFVFNLEQVKYIQNKLKNMEINVFNEDGIYYLSSNKEYTLDMIKAKC